MPIIDALSFDRGFHFSSIDYSGHLTSARDTSNYVDGVASLAFPTNSVGSHLNWVRHNFNAQHPTQPSTSLYVWPRSWYSGCGTSPRHLPNSVYDRSPNGYRRRCFSVFRAWNHQMVQLAPNLCAKNYIARCAAPAEPVYMARWQDMCFQM